MLESGKIYLTQNGIKFLVLFINDGIAYARREDAERGRAAYAWDIETGKSISLGDTYDFRRYL